MAATTAYIDDIGDFLQANGIGTLGTNLFLYYLPSDQDVPADAVQVLDTGGPEPNPYLLEKREVTFQLLVRDDNVTGARDKANAIYELLNTVQNKQLGATYFRYCLPIQPPASIGRDESGRDEFSFNYRASIR